MKYELCYDEARDVLAGRVSGELDPVRVREMASEFARLAKAHGCTRLLNDLREADTSHFAFHVHTMPRIVHEGGVATPCWRAIVVPAESEDKSFLESVARNIGETVGIFTDREAAMQWLSGRADSGSPPGGNGI